jgi:hypothetical protein
MAVLHRKEEKIQAVLGRLPKKYTSDDFVAMFIKLYSKDWGKIKSAYIKASQDREPGTVIHMPKPDLYLKQVLEIFLTQRVETTTKSSNEAIEAKEVASLPEAVEPEQAVVAKKTPVAKKSTIKKAEKSTETTVVKKTKAAPKKKAD